MPAKSKWITPIVKQSWIVSSVLWAMLGMGMGLGFTSCLLPALEAPDSDIKMDLETSSWLVAVLAIFCMVGYFSASILMNIYGRRIAYAVTLLPGIAGMLLISYAPNASSLIAGRALYGITAGSTTTLGAVVVGEYSSPEYRPIFLNLKTAFLYAGSTAVHLLGYYIHWRKIAVIMTIPTIIALFIAYTWPESPSWLAEKKMYIESEESFFSFRERTADSSKEIRELIHSQKEIQRKMTFPERLLDLLKKFTKKNFVKPVVIFFFAAMLLESSGRHIYPAYAAKIIKEIVGDTQNSFYFTFTLDVIITASAIFSSYLVRIMRLRILLFSTGLISFVILMTACLYLFLSSREVISADHTWIPMLLFALYFIFVNFGCAPIPLALIGEIFPLEHRAVGSSIAGYLIAAIMMVAFKIMPIMLVNLKLYGTFAVLGMGMAIALLVLYFMLPETKNKTLQEIDDFFKYGRYRADGNIDVNDDDKINDKINGGKKSSALAV